MIFANIMDYKKDLSSFWKKALHKYRFVIMTDDAFEEKLSVRLSRLNLFALGGFLVFLCFFSAILLITTTSLTEYIPGKATSEVQHELILLTIKADSLKKSLNTQKKYLQNINSIINDNVSTTVKNDQSFKKPELELSFEKSIDDSLLRVAVESEDRGSLLVGVPEKNQVLMFFNPINGLITDNFNLKTRHFGIDLVAKEKTRISSTLDGVVIISNWTSETGYTIGVQHKNGYISLYKHNSILLKSIGDFVNAGDHIAIIGNSGELSSGPHLHFELWHEGAPVNPKNYIRF